MSYQSPIEVIQTQMRNQIEGEIYNAVMNVGVNVDKEELIKALQYDREQYQKGYKDRDDQIIRCKDCKNYMTIHCTCDGCCISDDWFCADGKRRNDDG